MQLTKQDAQRFWKNVGRQSDPDYLALFARSKFSASSRAKISSRVEDIARENVRAPQKPSKPRAKPAKK